MDHCNNLHRLLHRGEDLEPTCATAAHETKGNALNANTAPKSNEHVEPRKGVGFACPDDPKFPVQDPDTSSESPEKPIWKPVTLPLPLDTTQMADTRGAVLQSSDSKHALPSRVRSSGEVSATSLGASWLPATASKIVEHPHLHMQQQGWMKVHHGHAVLSDLIA